MPICELAFATWEEVRDLDPSPSVAILPVGALEAHGPHLPMDTDVIIAQAMAREGARLLSEAGHSVLLLPPLTYTSAPFAAGFSGTVSVRPETVRALVEDIAASLAGSADREAGGGPLLVLANAHLDPAHVAVLRELADASPRILFPDITRRRLAERLTEEFRSGACHAGRYETSIVLAEAPERVRDEARSGLPPVPHSLTDGIRAGKRTFEEVGGPRAYFGDPAAATAEEGRRTIGVLGEILAEAVTGELPA
jgi:creatinine amidohydrolase